MCDLIPLPYKLLIGVAALGGLFGFGYMKGYSAASTKYKAEIESFQTRAAAQIDDLEKKNSEISDRVVTRYVDRIRTVREKEYVYVDAANNIVPSQFKLSRGWLSIHNASATGSVPDPAAGADATPSTVEDNTGLATVVTNYSICTQNSEQLRALQGWVSESKAAADASNAQTKAPRKKFLGLF